MIVGSPVTEAGDVDSDEPSDDDEDDDDDSFTLSDDEEFQVIQLSQNIEHVGA